MNSAADSAPATPLQHPVAAPQLTGSTAKARIRAIADTCVKCGLCIEQCPSYRVLQREQDSPRGRIALAAAMADGVLAADDPHALAALDRCLNCDTCTRVCPADVDYRSLIDHARSEFPSPTTFARRASRTLQRHRLWLRVLRPAARLVTRLRLPGRASSSPGTLTALRESLAAAPAGANARAAPGFTPAHPPWRGTIALFRGCVAGVLDADTQNAAARILSRIGYGVHSPRANHCCGALDRHHGRAQDASAAAEHALALYQTTPATRVIGTVSGCDAQLRTAVFGGTTLALDDLFVWLAADERLASLRFEPLPLRVAVQVPCTQRAIPGADAAMRQVLARIPGVEIIDLPQAPTCCGAAGTYFADHPGIARTLRDERLEQIRIAAPDCVVSSNVGCRLHLAAGLAQTGSRIEVLHPAVLLDRALPEIQP